uniref:Uncharacterized protein n=1 Tax=viral metagenome TaxID=1070528 RepID=A0A6M3LVS8_9ZZZZ
MIGDFVECQHHHLKHSTTSECYWCLVEERDNCMRMLENLLAIIHRDGGHYASEHGLEKSVKDAQKKGCEGGANEFM